MAAATLLSRVTGLLRTVALASALGVGVVSDAYNVANVAPTMIFTLVAGGVLTAAVVPMLARAGDAAAEVASVLLGAVLVVGGAASLVVALAAPQIVAVLGAGAPSDVGGASPLTVSWLRMFAPQVLLYGVSVLAVAVMTARRRLALGAAAPIATNVLTILAAVGFVALAGGRPSSTAAVDAPSRALLGWGTTAAIAVMAAIQLWGAQRCEHGLRLRVSLRHPALREVVSTGRWVLLYVAANQAGLAAVTALASSVSGGVSAYQWGFAVMQLPYAVVGVSLLSAAIPDAATASGRRSRTRAVLPAARATWALLAPCAAVLAVAAGPIAVAVVGTAGGSLVASAVRGFAVSLLPFAAFQLLTRACYAAGDVRSPAITNIAVNAVNVVAAVAAIELADGRTATITALALAHASSYVAGAVILGRRVHRRGVLEVLRITRPGLLPVATAAVVGVSGTALLDLSTGGFGRGRAIAVAAGIAGGVAVVFLPVWRRSAAVQDVLLSRSAARVPARGASR